MSITEKLRNVGVPGFRSGKKWKMAVAVFGYFWILMIVLAIISPSPAPEDTDNSAIAAPTPAVTATPESTPPEKLNQNAVKFIFGDKISGYTYEVEIITLLEGTEAPGKKNVFITYQYVYHDWLQNENVGTKIVRKLYTSQYNDDINGITIYFQENGENLVKLTLDKKDADKYANEWDDIMWLKRTGWTDSYFDKSIKPQE